MIGGVAPTSEYGKLSLLLVSYVPPLVQIFGRVKIVLGHNLGYPRRSEAIEAARYLIDTVAR